MRGEKKRRIEKVKGGKRKEGKVNEGSRELQKGGGKGRKILGREIVKGKESSGGL